MARLACVVVPDVPYHVTQRGNGRQKVFLTEDDYRFYHATRSPRSAKPRMSPYGPGA